MYADYRDITLPAYVRELPKAKRRQWVAIANRCLTEKVTLIRAQGLANGIVFGRKASEIDAAAHKAATSPLNDLPQPTEAQIKAGNYAKGHTRIHGLGVTIENPAGSKRSGTDPNGTPWEVTMSAHYGYLKRTEGADDEHIDCYIGPSTDSEKVFVINQADAESGMFDEHKIVFGTNSLAEAIALYDAHFSDGKGHLRRRGISQMSVDEFKQWLASGNTKTKTASDPDASAVHVNGLMTTATKTKKKSPHYLAKMCSLLAGKYTDEELKEMTNKARAHAGGMSKAEKARMKTMLNDDECAEMLGEDMEEDEEVMGEKGKACAEFNAGNIADMCADGHGNRLFVEYQFAEPPEWMPLLPKPGQYKHPEYGEINITKERNANFCDNFANGVYQSSLPINPEHQPDAEGAFGWIEEMRLNEDGSVDARVKWTDRGAEAIRKDRFRFISPEWQDKWADATGKVFQDVLRGAALTVRPFFKNNFMRPLVASEFGLQMCDQPATADNTQMFFFTALQPILLPAREAQPEPKENSLMSTENKAAVQAVDAQAFAEMQTSVKTLSEQNQQLTESVKLMKEANEAQAATIKTLSESNAALATEARQKRFTDMIKGRKDGAKPWHGDHVKHLDMLEKLTQAFGEDSDTFKIYVTQQETIAKQFAESNLFVEIGTDVTGDVADSNPTAQLEAKAKAYLATEEGKGKNFGEAFDHVMQDPENRKLYEQHRGRSVVDVNKRYGGTSN